MENQIKQLAIILDNSGKFQKQIREAAENQLMKMALDQNYPLLLL